MEDEVSAPDSKLYALVNYEDPYVQPLIISALEKRLPSSLLELITSLDQLPSPTAKCLQFVQYEAIDFEQILQQSSTFFANAYVIRKALIRKHYLSTTVANWITKYPESVLKKHVKPSVEFEVDYAEFLDDALIEAYELKESWERNQEKKEQGKEKEKERDWWILKPGMSERGQGIRLFSSEEELTAIFEEWDPESDDEEEEGEEDTRSGQGNQDKEGTEKEEGNGIITSQLRHFIAQPYIHPPLLLQSPSGSTDQAPRKFHIRTYVLAVGALQVYVYRPMLALFAARPYLPPWEAAKDEVEGLKSSLTNTCLQDSNDREGSRGLFWDLSTSIPAQQSPSSQTGGDDTKWKTDVFDQICKITGEVFEAAARSMSIHFQPLPNAFEIFGLDFMVGIEAEGSLNTYLLEVNAFPDFRQTGEELKDLVGGLFDGAVNLAIKPFFGIGADRGEEKENDSMIKVLDIDLGRR